MEEMSKRSARLVSTPEDEKTGLRIKLEEEMSGEEHDMKRVKIGNDADSRDDANDNIKIKIEDGVSSGASSMVFVKEEVPTLSTCPRIKTEMDVDSAANAKFLIETSEYFMLDEIDDRLPYRQGWPLLPVLPVVTSHNNVPKALSPSSEHIAEFRKILKKAKVEVFGFEVVQRSNPGKPIDKFTLTLCIRSNVSNNDTWPDAISALRSYIQSNDIILAIEIIDHRIFHGLYTLPILDTDKGVTGVVKRKRHGIIRILNDSGESWTSLECYYRGFGNMREYCKPTVLIGVPHPQRKVWWDTVLPKIKAKIGGKLEVELAFRELNKW